MALQMTMLRQSRLSLVRVGMLVAASTLSLLLQPFGSADTAVPHRQSGMTSPDLTWLLGHWSGALVGNPRQARTLTFSKTPLGVRGVLDERFPDRPVTRIGAYDIFVRGQSLLLQANEGSRKVRLKGRADPQSARFLRSSSAEGLILFEVRRSDHTLTVRRAFGPQHGASVEDLSTFEHVGEQ